MFINLIPQLNLINAKKEKQNMQNSYAPLPANLEKLVDGIENDTFESLWTKVDSYCEKYPDFQRIDNNLYKYNQYYIAITSAQDAQYHMDLFNTLQKNNINIAPTFVDYAQTKEEFALLITKIDDTESGNLIPFEQGYNLLSVNSKKEAFESCCNLLKLGIGNYDMFNKGNLYITPGKQHKIVSINWSGLYPINNEDIDAKKQIQKQMSQKLYRIS